VSLVFSENRNGIYPNQEKILLFAMDRSASDGKNKPPLPVTWRGRFAAGDPNQKKGTGTLPGTSYREKPQPGTATGKDH